MSVDWWPHEGEPYFLIDAPDDYMVEEHAHVPVRAIENDEYAEERAAGGLQAAALAFMTRYAGIDIPQVFDDDYGLVLTGKREWHRPTATRCDDATGEWIIETTGDQVRDDLAGAGRRSEYCPWEPCRADALNAVEFYVLEVRETIADLASGDAV